MDSSSANPPTSALARPLAVCCKALQGARPPFSAVLRLKSLQLLRFKWCVICRNTFVYRSTTHSFDPNDCRLCGRCDQCLSKCLPQGSGNRIADLPIAITGRALESPVIREALKSGVFTHRQRSRLRRMRQQSGFLHWAGDQRRCRLTAAKTPIETHLTATRCVGATHGRRLQSFRQTLPVPAFRHMLQVLGN